VGRDEGIVAAVEGWSGCGGDVGAFEVWIEEDLVLQQGAGEEKQAIDDAAHGSAVAVSAASELGVFGSAARIVLHGDARPMVGGPLQAFVAGQSTQDDAGLAAAPRHRSNADMARRELF
jgi:hypothetical protein